MEKAAYTKEQLAAYDKWKIAAMTERSAINDALRKGKAIGLEEGEAIGEQKKAILIAKNLLKKGMSMEDVSDATGLSKQQIEELV